MKKLFVAAMSLALILTACPQGEDGGGNKTTLTVKNESTVRFLDVLWNDAFLIGDGGSPMLPGMSATVDVSAGSGYVRFLTMPYIGVLRTRELLPITEGEKKEFVIFNNTIVVVEDGTTDSLDSIMDKYATTLTIKNESSYWLFDLGWNTINFGGRDSAVEPGGKSPTMDVAPGNAVIGFGAIGRTMLGETYESPLLYTEPLSIAQGDMKEFVISDTTPVVNAYDENESGTLKSIMDSYAEARKTHLSSMKKQE